MIYTIDETVFYILPLVTVNANSPEEAEGMIKRNIACFLSTAKTYKSVENFAGFNIVWKNQNSEAASLLRKKFKVIPAKRCPPIP